MSLNLYDEIYNGLSLIYLTCIDTAMRQSH